MAQLPRLHRVHLQAHHAFTDTILLAIKRPLKLQPQPYLSHSISTPTRSPPRPINHPLSRLPSTMSAQPSIDPRYLSLFEALESRFSKTTSIPTEKWSILAIAALVAGPDPERADQLYLYLTSKEPYSTSPARKELVRRLREALFKSVIIVGVCKPIEAILAIAQVEKDEDKDYSPPTRENWACDETNHERGVGWFDKLYARNGASTLDLFSAHKDFSWLSMEITYGLFLSDRQVLDDFDTQMVVLPAIMSQNLKKETHWHIRGTRRLGVSMEDVGIVCECVRLVAEFYGVRLDKVPTVEEVENDV
ncbi:hypothetical protein BDW59DRAFT_141699 [Aspergillus cavernicola]|uniref:AhpD-like protein n=1 Tax=Aspergillus cavernicola TaxID=176166 RepID=A0ABR4IQL1_9EURO